MYKEYQIGNNTEGESRNFIVAEGGVLVSNKNSFNRWHDSLFKKPQGVVL